MISESQTRESEPSGISNTTYTTALRLLARRDHSERELRQKLLARGAAAEQLDDVIAHLMAQGYLCDRRFAEIYAQSRLGRGFGLQRIALELQQRGVAADHIASVCAVQAMPEGELPMLRAVWQKKFRHPPVDLQDKGRQVRFLRQRGFSQEAIQQWFAELASEVR